MEKWDFRRIFSFICRLFESITAPDSKGVSELFNEDRNLAHPSGHGLDLVQLSATLHIPHGGPNPSKPRRTSNRPGTSLMVRMGDRKYPENERDAPNKAQKSIARYFGRVQSKERLITEKGPTISIAPNKPSLTQFVCRFELLSQLCRRHPLIHLASFQLGAGQVPAFLMVPPFHPPELSFIILLVDEEARKLSSEYF
jgi:hypothetical protein